MRRRLIYGSLILVPLFLLAVWRWQVSQRDNICEAVIRYQIKHLDTQLNPKPLRYYIGINGHGPAPRFMARFRDLGKRAETIDVARRICGGYPIANRGDGK